MTTSRAVNSRLVVLALLALAACRKTQPPPSVPPPPRPTEDVVRAVTDARVADAHVPPPDAAPPMSDRCRQLAVAAGFDVDHAHSVLGMFHAPALARLEAFKGCVDSPNGGAWVLALDRIDRREPDGSTGWMALGSWSLVHVNASGQRVAVAPALSPCGTLGATGDTLHIEDMEGDANGTRFVAFSGFDWDHDGESEVFLRFEENDQGVEDAPTGSRCGRVWSFRGGAIVPYAPAGSYKLERMEDVDHDGRPDLTTHGAYVGALVYGDTPPPINDERGPELVLHSVADGTFSLTDAAAVAGTRARCAALEADTSYGLNLGRVACARMHGRTAAQVLAAVRAECGPTGNGQGDFCNSQREIRRWTALPVPVLIGP